MSIQTKIRFKNIGKIVGGILFALILFTNIKVALLDNAEFSNSDISILGIELNIFDATFANESGDKIWKVTCTYNAIGILQSTSCTTGGSHACYCPPSI